MALSKPLTEAFEEFWAAYPRRPENPKAAAREVFARRVREGADPAAIVRAAGAYAQAVAGKDSAFIPHARTWLSQRRYEDYSEAPAPAAETRPDPEHPLAWLAPILGDAAWRSWIAPLALTLDPPTIHCRTGFARDHVRGRWGDLFRERYGPELLWTVQPRDAA